MMTNKIYGIGTDILQKNRIEKICSNEAKTIAFAKKILTEDEMIVFESKTDKTSYLAKRFCGKEAIAKAMQSGIGQNFSFKDASILNNPSGAPHIKFSEKFSALNFAAQISLSDEKTHCLAFCIVFC